MTDAAARILIIDDDPMIRTLVEAILLIAGHIVLTAEDAADGLRQASTELPDLILLDRRMPDTDGLEVLRTLRASFQTSELPVVMLTADSDDAARIDCLRAGADDYIIKPFNPDDLAARVADLLHRARSPSRPALRSAVAR